MILSLFLCSALHSDLIEFYADWSWNCKGTALFSPPQGWKGEEWAPLWTIQSLLREKGWEIKCWDWEFYKPLLAKGDLSAWNALPMQERELTDRIWILWNMAGNLSTFDFSRVPKEKLILFMWEPPTVQLSLYTPAIQALFGKIFTWDDDLVDNKKFFKFNYPVLKKRIEPLYDFDQKKLCVMVNSHLKSTYPKELYSERDAVARFFEDKEGEFDLYGHSWDQLKLKNWRGKTPNKIDTIKKYRFCIAYENTRDIKGYITEKIFDCFQAGCVPIYWGASNICDSIPPECFIDRRKFKNTQELYDFMKQINRAEYETYLEKAAQFLQSEKAQLFSREAFVKIFMNQIVNSQTHLISCL